MPIQPSPPGPLRVVVIDADDRVRESLAGLLCIGDHLCVVGSAGQCGPGFEIVLATDPDILVIDPRLPDVDAGLALIGRVRAAVPRARIVIMGGAAAGDATDLHRVADGYVRKTFRPADLVAAVIAAVPIAS